MEIVLRGIAKAYGTGRRRRVALVDIDLTVPDGSVLVVAGPSGAGKSALLRVIAGLDLPDAGDVRFDGVDVAHVPTHNRDLALVTANPRVPGRWTVRESLEAPIRYRSGPAGDPHEQIAAEARALHIASLLDRPVAALSAGDRQLVALARALIGRPRAYLLDEPTVHLDPLERQHARAQFQQIRSVTHTTTIQAAQDPGDAMATADLVAVLDRGRVIQVGTPRACFDTPANTLVAEVVGGRALQLVPVRAEGRQLVIGEQQIAVPRPLERQLHGGEALLLGVRSRALTTNGPGVALPVSVCAVRGAGPSREVEVAVEPLRDNAPRLLVVLPPERRVEPGTGLVLRLDLHGCSVFEHGSGLAIWHGVS